MTRSSGGPDRRHGSCSRARRRHAPHGIVPAGRLARGIAPLDRLVGTAGRLAPGTAADRLVRGTAGRPAPGIAAGRLGRGTAPGHRLAAGPAPPGPFSEEADWDCTAAPSRTATARQETQ